MLYNEDDFFEEKLQFIRDAKEKVKKNIEEDATYVSRLQQYSDNLQVIAKVLYTREERKEYQLVPDVVWGYAVENISNEVVPLLLALDTFKGFLMPGQFIVLTHEEFIKFACIPEVSFRFNNGKVIFRVGMKEQIKLGQEIGKYRTTIGSCGFVEDEGRNIRNIYINEIEEPRDFIEADILRKLEEQENEKMAMIEYEFTDNNIYVAMESEGFNYIKGYTSIEADDPYNYTIGSDYDRKVLEICGGLQLEDMYAINKKVANIRLIMRTVDMVIEKISNDEFFCFEESNWSSVKI